MVQILYSDVTEKIVQNLYFCKKTYEWCFSFTAPTSQPKCKSGYQSLSQIAIFATSMIYRSSISQPKCIREQRGYQTKTLLLKVAILLLQIVRQTLSKGTHKNLLTLIGSVIEPFVDDLPSCYHLVSTAFRYDDAPWQHEHDSRDWCVVQHHDHYYGMWKRISPGKAISANVRQT